MKCKKFETWILHSLDQRLKEKDKGKLEEHMKTCPHCQEKEKEYRNLLSLTKEKTYPEPKPYFWERLQTKIRERQTPSLWPAMKRWSLRAVPFSLLVMLLIALMVWLISPHRDQELSQSEALLLRNSNPLQETQLLLEGKPENQNMMLIFSSLEERDSPRRDQQ